MVDNNWRFDFFLPKKVDTFTTKNFIPMAKILIIDDEKTIRTTLKEILEYEGYTVDEAADEGDKFVASRLSNFIPIRK